MKLPALTVFIAGQKFNQDGIETTWWTNESVQAFQQREPCFIHQYSQYSMFGIPLNGVQTLGENIADNGGLKTAYQAYQNVAMSKNQPTLPAINLTPEQLFFVAFAQVTNKLYGYCFIIRFMHSFIINLPELFFICSYGTVRYRDSGNL